MKFIRCTRALPVVGFALTALLDAAPVQQETDKGDIHTLDKLEAGFLDPPQQARPLVWWDWLNGSITKDGIKADLEDMKRVGIGGVQLFDLELYMPAGAVRYGTDNWHEHVQFAIETAENLGLEFHIMNCPGWSASGGPWITPAKSMKKIIWCEENVIGTRGFSKKLKRPEIEHNGGRDIEHDFYKDIAIIAVPTDQGTPYRLPDADKKIGFSPPNFNRPVTSISIADERAIPGDKVLNLTKHFEEGVLACDLPDGNWTIIRFGFTSTGRTNHPAVPEGHGLEVDKFDPDAVKFQFEQALSRIIAEAAPRLGETFKGLLFDSFEGGYQNWTDAFPELFQAINGYDLMPFLPVLTGRVIESANVSEAVLYDFRGTIDQLFAQNYYAVMQQLAHDNQLVVYSESQGGPLNPFFCNEFVDVPMNEFWVGNYKKRVGLMKLTASSANLYGRQIVGAEAFTAVPDDGKWQNTPYSLKLAGDCAFAAGMNRFSFHTYIHQPYSYLKPGFTMGRYGTHFGRLNTWWKFAPAWIDYLSRSQFLLQQGKRVTDIGFLFPNEIRYSNPSSMTNTPFGFDYTIFYPRHLAQMQVHDGQIMVSGGPAFKVLVLPDQPFLSVETLLHVRRLVESGGIIVGNPPIAPPGLLDFHKGQETFNELVEILWGGVDPEDRNPRKVGKGLLFPAVPVENVISYIGLKPDFEIIPDPVGAEILYLHRKTEAEEIYFISNQAEHKVDLKATFRVTGKRPELWDPSTGKIWNEDIFEILDETTKMPLTLDPRGSIFVIFREPPSRNWITSIEGKTLVRMDQHLLSPEGGTFQVNYSDQTTRTVTVNQPTEAMAIAGPWQVRFLDGRGAPWEIQFTSLIPWTENPNPEIRYYSGVAEYITHFDIPENAIKQDERVVLSLGQVCDIASVRINGGKPRTVWKEPFQLDLTGLLVVGQNEITIQVANRWINRLIGDERLPADIAYRKDGSIFTNNGILEFPEWLMDPELVEARQRQTFTTWRHYFADSPLVPSGLLGPVRLIYFKDVDPNVCR